jgi:hypothetical protein
MLLIFKLNVLNVIIPAGEQPCISTQPSPTLVNMSSTFRRRPSLLWMEGYTPTPAQQAVIDRLLEEGNDHEAQVWFLVYQMEADPIVRKAMEVANQ